MEGYTKLYSSIVFSTIWREDDKTRLVWITMLAISDENGDVKSSIPGLADAARVSIPECENALKKLLSPDKYSRSKAKKGRRITQIEGGWCIVNRNKYRNMSQDRTGYWRLYKQKQRKGGASTVDNVDNVELSTNSTQAEAKAEAEAKKEVINTFGRFHSFWEIYPRKTDKQEAKELFKKLNPDAELFEQILVAVKAQCKSEQWSKDGGKFIPNPARWLRRRKWEDSLPEAPSKGFSDADKQAVREQLAADIETMDRMAEK